MAASALKADRRTTVRFPLQLPVSVQCGAERHAAITRNISAGGVLLFLEADLEVGSTIEFTISLPAPVLGVSADVLVNCVGRVVRCTPQGSRRLVAAVIDEYHFQRQS